jgi:hypothetical protein
MRAIHICIQQCRVLRRGLHSQGGDLHGFGLELVGVIERPALAIEGGSLLDRNNHIGILLPGKLTIALGGNGGIVRMRMIDADDVQVAIAPLPHGDQHGFRFNPVAAGFAERVGIVCLVSIPGVLSRSHLNDRFARGIERSQQQTTALFGIGAFCMGDDRLNLVGVESKNHNECWILSQ